MIHLVIVSIVSITLTGCSNSWSKEEKQVLQMQAKGMSILSKNNKDKYAKCFEEYILDNYNGKEYLRAAEGAAVTAMMHCKKYNDRY